MKSRTAILKEMKKEWYSDLKVVTNFSKQFVLEFGRRCAAEALKYGKEIV